MERETLNSSTIISEVVDDAKGQLLRTISDLSASNMNHLQEIRKLQGETDKLSNQMVAMQYKLVEMSKAKDLYQNAMSTFVMHTSDMLNVTDIRDCVRTVRDSLVKQFKFVNVDILFRTLGGVYEPNMTLSTFLNSRELATNFSNIENHVDTLQKQNMYALIQCNSEQTYMLGSTYNYVYSAIAVHETQPVFAIIFERELPLEVYELQLLENMLRAYAIIISFERRLMQSTILSSAYASKYQHAVEKSLTDTLTKVYNQRALLDNLERNYKNTQYLIIFYDIDKFKYINDTFGHPAGDQVLVWFAQTVRDFCTELGGDTYRYGGDEFISIFVGGEDLIHLVENNLENLMEKIRQKEFVFAKTEEQDETDGENVVHEEVMCKHKITTSIGLYYNKDFLPFDKAKKLADDGLYKSKKAGRNTITVIGREMLNF